MYFINRLRTNTIITIIARYFWCYMAYSIDTFFLFNFVEHAMKLNAEIIPAIQSSETIQNKKRGSEFAGIVCYPCGTCYSAQLKRRVC